jgi:transcriptional regulator with XRE-family HTH domain
MFQKVKDKKYRSRFIAGQIKTGIPFQLRALRSARKLTQKGLGEAAQIPQTVISRIENGSGGNLSVKTLLKLAEAFDVALVIRFEPIDKLIDWADSLSPEVLAPEASEKVLAEIERKGRELEKAAGSTPARHLRLLNARVATAAVQRTLPFNAPTIAVANNDTATPNQPTVTPQSTSARLFKAKAARA